MQQITSGEFEPGSLRSGTCLYGTSSTRWAVEVECNFVQYIISLSFLLIVFNKYHFQQNLTLNMFQVALFKVSVCGSYLFLTCVYIHTHAQTRTRILTFALKCLNVTDIAYHNRSSHWCCFDVIFEHDYTPSNFTLISIITLILDALGAFLIDITVLGKIRATAINSLLHLPPSGLQASAVLLSKHQQTWESSEIDTNPIHKCVKAR